MSFLELLKIEFMKVKRSKIVPLIFIAPLLVVASGVASLSPVSYTHLYQFQSYRHQKSRS